MLGKNYIELMYKNHIKELLFNEEKTLIPLSMITVKANKEIKEIIIEKEKFKAEYSNELSRFDMIKLQYKIKAHDEYIRYLKMKPVEKTKVQYKYPCATINCDGFVNNKWTCEICDKTTCKYCFKIKGKSRMFKR